MNNCIFCNQELNYEKISTEHIIPRCMGGKLKSKLIICRKCNSKFGTEFDESLIKRFMLILHPIRLFNKKLKIKDVIVELNGRKYLLTEKGIKLKDPTPATGSGGFLDMIFPSEKSLETHLQRMKRKDPTIDIQATIDNSKTEIVEIKEPFTFIIENINDKVYRCCGKIVYEFLYHRKEDYQPSDDFFTRFVMGDLESSNFPVCVWYSEYAPIEKGEDSIYHIIVIEGRKESKILVGYLRVFNCLDTLLILDRDYKGPSFIEGYYQDLLNDTQGYFTPLKNVQLSSENIKNLIDNFDPLEVMEDYGKRIFHVLDMSRLLPIKKELEILAEILQSKFESSEIELSKYTYENLILILDRYGLYIALKDSLDKVLEDYEDFSFLIKIEKIFSYLLHYFARKMISIEAIQKIIKMVFNYK